jgi:hypothetical protein
MKATSRLRLLRDETGATAIIIGLSTTALMGGAALALDVGLWYNDKRIAQGAADSAAYSAAIDSAAGGSATHVASTAKAIAAQYGQVDGSNGVTVTVNTPPQSGSHTTTTGAIEVIIQRTETPLFASFFVNSAGVAARAVAVPASTTTNGSYCALVLDSSSAATSATAGINASNGAVVDMTGCGVQVNASGSDALYIGGGSTLKAANVSIVGSYTTSNGGTLQVTGSTKTSAPTMSDPYANVAVPTPGTCAATNSWGYGTWTLSPGTYCNGMTFSNGAKVTLTAGTYIVDRGSFTLQGGSTLTATAGVTIVLTSSTGSNYATMSITNGTTLNITAPSTGAMKGIAVYQDRRAETTNTDAINGGSNINVGGALYFPAQLVSFSNGATSTSTCTQLIAYRVTFTGGAYLRDNCSGFGVTEIGSTSTTTGLVE